VRDALARNPDGDEEIARAARLIALLAEEAEATEGLPLPEAADLVARRLPLLRAQPRDRRHDCVYAVDAQDARQWEKPVVLVAGLTADAFPRQFRQDSFLRDDERKELGDERDFHLPLRARREDEERYLFYVALTRAQERLVLSYPAYDEQGTPRAPSPYLEETLAHFAGYPARRIELSEQYAQARDAVRRADLLPIVADGLNHGSALAAGLHGLGAVDRDLLALPRRLELARARPAATPPGEVRLSASAINAWLRCPYLLLVRSYLGVAPARAPGLDPLLRGLIAHAALEECGRHPDADAAAIFDRIFAERTAGLRLGLSGAAERRWLRAAVLRVAARLASMPVERVELPFALPMGEATLRGRIDRVEAHPAGQLIRDFKTGRPSLNDIESGTDIQLDAYLLAVENPAGAVFERLRNADCVGLVVEELRDVAPGRGVRVVSREELAGRREQMRALVARVAAAARAGRLAVKPREPERCTRAQCDGYDLCRVARARFLEKAGRAKWPS